MHELQEMLSREPTNILREISPKDIQYKVNPDLSYYLSAGRSALRCIRLALLTAGRGDPKSILDLPCGHERVLRTLKAAFPSARLTACDLDHDSVEFCCQAFGATPVYSRVDPVEIPLNGLFDLIWVGSLLTHLDYPRWIPFLARFQELLTIGGVLVFTTHGRFVADRLRTREFTYGLSPETIHSLVERFQSTGFGYQQYPSQDNYGISLSTPAWVCSQLAATEKLQLVNYTEKGWNQHQDVVACRKSK